MTVTLLLACATPDEDLQGARDALATDLWAQIDGYESWTQQDPWTGVQPSSDNTHGEYVQIWLNDAAVGSYAEDAAADDSIVVKRGYRDEAAADAYGNITVMWKTDDPSVAETGWLWVSYGAADGAATKAEDNAGCAGCHASGSDYRRMVTDVPTPGR